MFIKWYNYFIMNPQKKVKYPLPLNERKFNIENPTYEQQDEADRREEIVRNMNRNSR